jgi:hypothetical protein
MAEARCRDHWAHTSAVLAMLANVHRDHRKKPTPYKPDDFNPFQQRRGQVVQKAPIDVLKHTFVKEG